jgi:hypothetical protein
LVDPIALGFPKDSVGRANGDDGDDDDGLLVLAETNQNGSEDGLARTPLLSTYI